MSTYIIFLFRMNLQDVIDRLRSEADMYSPLPSAFRNRRQRREDRLIERVLNFLITILHILDSNSSLEGKIQEIVARIAFFGGDHTP